jgi:hypothetical protein
VCRTNDGKDEKLKIRSVLREHTSHLRPNVQPTPLPVRIRRQLQPELRVRVKRCVVNHECAILAHRVNVQRSRAECLSHTHILTVSDVGYSICDRREPTLVIENDAMVRSRQALLDTIYRLCATQEAHIACIYADVVCSSWGALRVLVHSARETQ